MFLHLVRPLGLKLEGNNPPFSADRLYELTCTSWGARPPVSITWWRGGTRLRPTRQTVLIFIVSYPIRVV